MASITSPITALSASVPIGVTIPITRGNAGYFQQTYTAIDEVKSNLLNLLLTKKGERPFQPDFGCEVSTFLFEQITDTAESNIKLAIESSVNKWMPFLNINSIVVVSDKDHEKIAITVTFSLKNNANILATVVLTF